MAINDFRIKQFPFWRRVSTGLYPRHVNAKLPFLFLAHKFVPFTATMATMQDLMRRSE